MLSESPAQANGGGDGQPPRLNAVPIFAVGPPAADPLVNRGNVGGGVSSGQRVETKHPSGAPTRISTSVAAGPPFVESSITSYASGIPALSRVGSLVYFVAMFSCWFLFTGALFVSIAAGERALTGSPFSRPVRCRSVLGFIGPIGSMMAMSSPLLSVYRAVRLGSPDHGLQTHLIGAFAANAVIGLCYGWRKNLLAIQSSFWGSLAVQVAGLAGVYSLSRIPDVAVKKMFDMLRESSNVCYHLLDRLDYGRVASCIKWLLFIVMMTIGIGTTAQVFLTVPLDAVLSPVYAISNILPYMATFSTFKRDLRTFRFFWMEATDSRPAAGPPGVDLVTLSVMHINNIVWILYGSFLPDFAVIISSVAGLVATAVQLNCYVLPVVTLQFQDFSKAGAPSRLVRIDPGWVFLGDFALKVHDLLSPPESPRSRVDVELSAAERAGGIDPAAAGGLSQHSSFNMYQLGRHGSTKPPSARPSDSQDHRLEEISGDVASRLTMRPPRSLETSLISSGDVPEGGSYTS